MVRRVTVGFSSLKKAVRFILFGASGREEPFRRVVPSLVFIAVGIVSALILFFVVEGREEKMLRRELEQYAAKTASTIHKNLNFYVDVLRSLQRFCDASSPIRRDEFQSFASDLLKRYPGFASFVWRERVRVGERARFERRLHSEGFPTFKISERSSGGVVSYDELRPEYVPVTYVEPMESRQTLLGVSSTDTFDVAILNLARDTGRLTVSGVIGIRTDRNGRRDCRGHELFLAVYGDHQTAASVSEKRASLRGFVSGTFCAADIIKAALNEVHPEEVSVRVYGQDPQGEATLLFASGQENPSDEVGASLRGGVEERIETVTAGEFRYAWETRLDVGIEGGIGTGDDWTIHFSPTKRFLAGYRFYSVRIITAVGLIITLVLLIFLAGVVRRARGIERLVSERTGELLAANERFRIKTEESEAANVELTRQAAERKATESALRKSEALYESLVETVDCMVFRKDREGRFTFVNGFFCRDIGLPADQIVGKTDYDFFPDRLAEKYRQDDKRVMEAREAFQDIEEHIAPSGERRYYHVMKAPIFDENRTVMGIQGISLDITEHRKTEAALKESEERFRQITQVSREWIWETDAEARYTYCSPGVKDILGYEPEEIIGMRPFDLRLPEDREKDEKMIREIFAKKEPFFRLVNRKLHKDGQIIINEVSGLPMVDSEGKLLGYRGMMRDVTEQKLAEEELIEARQAAEAANRAKSLFLANMSHEIRTPLNAIIGMTELCSARHMDSETRDCVTTIRTASDALLAVLNDVLDEARIEAGKLELEMHPFSLHDVLDESLKIFAVQAQEKGLALESAIAPEIQDMAFLGDSSRLRQVFVNLIGNAIKFTEKGKVQVGANLLPPEFSDDNSEEVRLHFFVTDTGVGIPDDKRASLFKPFSQVDPSPRRKFGGSGLGLAISFQLVERMRGNIWVESAPGQGSTFNVEVPLLRFREEVTVSRGRSAVSRHDRLEVKNRSQCDVCRHPSLSVDASKEAPNVFATALKNEGAFRILVVEDNAVNRRIVVALLERAGYTVTAVEGGREALKLMGSDPDVFDMILMDVQMPEMDGYETTIEIREREKMAGRRIPIVAMTALALKGDDRRCFEAGMDFYLAKPIEAAVLFRTIGEVKDMIKSNRKDGGNGVIDKNAILDRLDGNRALLSEMAGLFLENAPIMLKNVKDAVSRRDSKALALASHTLKGSVSNFLAQEAVAAALKLETMGRSGKLERLEESYAALESEIERLKPALQALQQDREE